LRLSGTGIYRLLVALAASLMPAASHAALADDRQRRCLTLVAYAEAATEGPLGMLAVMKVIRNRMAHASFAGDACAVALQRGQFQPVAERPELRRALQAPENGSLAAVAGATSATARLQLLQAWRMAAGVDVWPARAPTGGAIYFVNPRLMDPGKCPWFASLKRTAAIGQHVFMADYAPQESRGAPALDCSVAGHDFRRRVRPLADP